MAYVKDVNAVIASRQELAGTKAVVDPTTKKPPPKKKKRGGSSWALPFPWSFWPRPSCTAL